MTGTEYTLTGFDDFLERRRVVFVQPLPSIRVCNVCGVVPSSSQVLSCGHVVCNFCKGQIAKGDRKCPLDDAEFSDADVVVMTFKQSDLEQRHVLCVAGGQKCSFAGKLSELKDHLIECGSDEVRCVKCQQSLIRSLAIEHCQKCRAHTASGEPVSAAAIASVAEGLSDIKRDVEKIKERASIEKDDTETVVNTANSLAERLTGLQRQLVEAQGKTSAEQCHSLLSLLKKAQFTPGPHRSPSKQGNFIATYSFFDVVTGNDALKKYNSSHEVSCGVCILAGYTFKLTCNFTYYSEDPLLIFFFSLLEGGWDFCLEWPFSKKVTLILTHPWCATKDIRLPVPMELYRYVRRPLLGIDNSSAKTSCVKFDDYKEFIIHNSLYVNVEIE